MYQTRSLYVNSLRRYERRWKMQKLGADRVRVCGRGLADCMAVWCCQSIRRWHGTAESVTWAAGCFRLGRLCNGDWLTGAAAGNHHVCLPACPATVSWQSSHWSVSLLSDGRCATGPDKQPRSHWPTSARPGLLPVHWLLLPAGPMSPHHWPFSSRHYLTGSQIFCRFYWNSWHGSIDTAV